MPVGTKWYKCDLHLHTPASRCFRDQTITAPQWVQEALDKGLHCVAVTDHNTGAWIDQIKAAAAGTGLMVFPGVELTCSDAKVHLLVLFGVDKGSQQVEDFILLTGIPRGDFGQQEAHAPKSVEEIFALAQQHQAICIPAHIDEFNGISEMGNQPRLNFLANKELLGVQVVHEAMTKTDNEYNRDRTQTGETLNRYYREDTINKPREKWKVGEERIKNWRLAVTQSQAHNKAILTFSDNPHQEGDPLHGLWGIGRRYSWIKMDQNPGLEGLRQAFLLHKFRVRNDSECPAGHKPYIRPEVIIRRITICDTHISEPLQPFEALFSPQMTTIIGGRGSGKSTVIQVLRGLFGKQRELESLELVHEDFKRFYRSPDTRKPYGILKNGCSFEVELEKEEEVFHLKYSHQSNATEVQLFRRDASGALEPIVNYQDFLHLLDFEIYSQKQIYEVATNLNSLREKIDGSDAQLVTIKEALEAKRGEYKVKSAEVRALHDRVSTKGKLEAEINDLENKINRYRESALEEYIHKMQVFDVEHAAIERSVEKLKMQRQHFQVLAESLQPLILEHLNNGETVWRLVFQPLLQSLETNILSFKNQVETLEATYLAAIVEFKTQVDTSAWAIERTRVSEEFQRRKQQLSDAGIDEAERIEEFMKDLVLKKEILANMLETEVQIQSRELERAQLKSEFVVLRQQLTIRRKAFLQSLLQGGNVQAKVNACRDMHDLETQIRRYAGAEVPTFLNDVNALIGLWSEGDAVTNNSVFNQHLADIRQGRNAGSWEGRFISKIKTLSGESFDDFELLFPEDAIQIEYRNDAGVWKPISNVSAGQKTAAILTLILSQGTKPLLLDQPEDDLDNGLIYDLVVDQLRKSKESRQIIVVTHNPNIPVNGDSEYIIVMDAESKGIRQLAGGCIEEQPIKDAICKIMEGGIDAFDMRSRRYKNM